MFFMFGNFFCTFVPHLAPKAQFFFATHSPLIASSFDPWEIIELKFTESGNIEQDPMYRGERTVENFRLHPKYLRWDSILQRIFDLDQEGNVERVNKLKELSELDVRLKAMKANGKSTPTDLKEVWQKYQKVAELLDWKITTHEKN